MKKLPLIMLSIALFLSSCNSFNSPFTKKKRQRELAEKMRLDSIAQAKEDSIQRVEELQWQLEQARLDSLQKAEEEAQAQAEQAPKIDKYHVIAGSFKIPAHAEQYAKTMSCKGYESSVIDGKKGYVYVSVGKFNTFASAANLVKKIRDEDDFVVWIKYPTN